MDALEAWLAAGGARYDGLEIRARGGGRGVYATRAIAAGTVVMRVPRALLVTSDVVDASAIGRAIAAAGVALSGTHARHAAWLVAEAGDPGSPWAPYLAALPRDQRAFPLHAAPDERAVLGGTRAGALLDELAAELVLDHLAVEALLGGAGRDAFTWARLAVGSRVFGVTIDGVETSALVPLGDLFDHALEPTARWAYEDGAFTVTAARDLPAGDEVFISYGAKGNHRLLVQYGFSLDDNPHDEAELFVPAPFLVPRDPAHASSVEMLDWLRAHHGPHAGAAALADAARAALAALVPDDDARLAAAAPAVRRARRGEQDVLRAWLAFAATLA